MPNPLKYTRRERHAEMVTATAIVYGFGANMSAAELVELWLERGIPSRGEREQIRDEKAREDNTLSSSPELTSSAQMYG